LYQVTVEEGEVMDQRSSKKEGRAAMPIITARVEPLAVRVVWLDPGRIGVRFKDDSEKIAGALAWCFER
jgi:hypothetical protein